MNEHPFRAMHLEKKVDTFTVKLNDEERKEFDSFKYALQQEKDSTAVKQLAWIGAKVLLDEKNKQLLGTIMGNYRKNKRQGIVTFD